MTNDAQDELEPATIFESDLAKLESSYMEIGDDPERHIIEKNAKLLSLHVADDNNMSNDADDAAESARSTSIWRVCV